MNIRTSTEIKNLDDYELEAEIKETHAARRAVQGVNTPLYDTLGDYLAALYADEQRREDEYREWEIRRDRHRAEEAARDAEIDREEEAELAARRAAR